jgi:ATPase subunit of ABC transporter with duplicated ATPase domains
MEPLVDRRRAVAKVRAADGGLEERFVPVSELVLAQISDEHRHPIAFGIRQALARTVLVDRDPGLEPRFEYGIEAARARRRAVKPLRALLHEAVPDRATAARLAEALRAFVPSVVDVVREPRTGELAEIHLVEEGSPEPARFDELSAGVRQMLLLAALYVHPSPPSLVLLEEPDAALHAGAIPALRDLLRALSQRTTVIATSHRIDLVRELDASEEVRVLDRRDGRPHVSSLADAKAERRWLRAFDPDEALARFGRERGP